MLVNTLWMLYHGCECKDHALKFLPKCKTNTKQCKGQWTHYLEMMSCLTSNEDSSSRFYALYLNHQYAGEMKYNSIFKTSYTYLPKCERYNLLYQKK